MSRAEQQPPHDLIITTAAQRDDVAQILYGLSLRGVRASSMDNPDRGKGEGAAGDRFLIVLDSPSDIQRKIADESIGPIWDAILEDVERAVTVQGACAFCGYNVSGLPRPTTCPECGRELDSIRARREVRARGF